MIQPMRPDRAVRSIRALRRWGPTPAAAYTGSAARYPDRAAIVDERGTLTFDEVQRRTNALARGLQAEGVGEGDGVAIMCRNHRGFIDATIACSKLGANALYLNTAFAGPQIADVLRREDPKALIYDEEFADLVSEGCVGRKCFVAWRDPGEAPVGAAAGGADRERDGLRTAAAEREGSRGDPDVGHDRDAEGRGAQTARVDGSGGGAVLEDPAEGARDDDDRRADVPLVGLRALHARACRWRARWCCAALRPRGHAAGGRPTPRERAGGCAGDAAADSRAAEGDDRAVRHALRCR